MKIKLFACFVLSLLVFIYIPVSQVITFSLRLKSEKIALILFFLLVFILHCINLQIVFI